MGKARDLFKKIRDQGNISCKDWLNKGQKWYEPICIALCAFTLNTYIWPLLTEDAL